MSQSASLQLALQLEQDGYDHYMKFASQTDNPLAKSLLTTLAEQELQHKAMVEKIYHGEVPSEAIDPNEVEGKLKDVFESFTQEERSDWTSDNMEIYEKAMELEKAAYQLYEELAGKTESPEEKKFFEDLMVQESKHLESIINVYYYLSDPKDWLSHDESTRWNWMV